MEFPGAVTHVPLPTAAPVKQLGLGASLKATSTVLYLLREERMCFIHLSGPDSLSLRGDLSHLHVGHRTISLTFQQKRQGPSVPEVGKPQLMTKNIALEHNLTYSM